MALDAVAAPNLIPMPRKAVFGEDVYLLYADEVTAECLTMERDSSIPKEGYRLSVDGKGIRVCVADDAGVFYMLQTLRQLAVSTGKGSFTVPYVEIIDSPQYRWRGVMVDEARHFLGKETIKKLLDLMGQYKLNVFHWHLVDDQGWRIEIKRHPELVKYGATRPASVAYGSRPSWTKGGVRWKTDAVRYGPYFYTQNDIREVVAYAAERHITVVPEIEVPEHVRALLAACPGFGCRGRMLRRVPRVVWGVESDVLCAGNDEAVRYMEDVFDELCSLFPSEYFHIGGDECPRKRWKDRQLSHFVSEGRVCGLMAVPRYRHPLGLIRKTASAFNLRIADD